MVPTITNAYELIELLDGESDAHLANEILTHLWDYENDFVVDKYRIVSVDFIPDALIKDLENGETESVAYFPSFMIANALGVNIELIDFIKESNGYQLLGESLLENCNALESLVESVICNETYGNVLNAVNGWYAEIWHDSFHYVIIKISE